MVRFARRSVLALLIGTFLAACGSASGATTSPSPTIAPTTAPTTAPTLSPDPTTTPSATPNPPVQAPVTGTFSSPGCVPCTITITTNDARVSGTQQFEMKYQPDESGDEAWVSGAMHLANDGGTWDGTCLGAGWYRGNRDELSCWLTGNDGYAGLTYFQHLSFIVNLVGNSSGAFGGDVYGVILPIPAPTP